MRITICTLSIAALLGSGGALAAQSTTQPRPDATPSQEETKVTGCLKEAPPSTGSGSSESKATKFVLEVMAPHAGMPSTTRTPETSRTETPDQTTRVGEKQTYALMAMRGVDLAKHVNHVVELTGTKAKMSGTSESIPRSSSAGGVSAAGEHPMFHVTGVRMVSTSCNQTSQ